VELFSYLSQSSIALFRSSLEYTNNLLTTIHVQDFVRTPFSGNFSLHQTPFDAVRYEYLKADGYIYQHRGR